MKNGGKRLGIRFLALLLPGLPLLALGPDPFERLFEEPRPGYAVPGLPLPKGYGNYRFGMSEWDGLLPRHQTASKSQTDVSIRTRDHERSPRHAC